MFVDGSLGSTLGPVFITVAISIIGIKGTLLFFIPEILVCLLIGRFYKKLVALGEIEKVSKNKEISYDTIKKDSWGALCTLLALPSNVYLATLLLLPMGVAIQMVYSPMVVLRQQYLSNHVGLASGVTLGLAVSIGGVFATCLGMIADNFGLITTMYVIAAIAVIPMIVAFILPSEKRRNFMCQRKVQRHNIRQRKVKIESNAAQIPVINA